MATKAIVSGVHVPELPIDTLQPLLQRRHAHLAARTVFITGDALSPSVSQALADTGRPWLEKPFSRDALLDAVRRLIDQQAL